MKLTGGGENARSDKQRIPWQKKSDEEPGFYENDDAHEHCAAPFNEALNVKEEMKEAFD